MKKDGATTSGDMKSDQHECCCCGGDSCNMKHMTEMKNKP
jgi:hypothetical protein